MVPRVLNASKCPPHNVVHDLCQYGEYYDPLYSPADHSSLFDSESSVCAWVLDTSGKREFPFEQLETAFVTFGSYFFSNLLSKFVKVASSKLKVD